MFYMSRDVSGGKRMGKKSCVCYCRMLRRWQMNYRINKRGKERPKKRRKRGIWPILIALPALQHCVFASAPPRLYFLTISQRSSVEMWQAHQPFEHAGSFSLSSFALCGARADERPLPLLLLLLRARANSIALAARALSSNLNVICESRVLCRARASTAPREFLLIAWNMERHITAAHAERAREQRARRARNMKELAAHVLYVPLSSRAWWDMWFSSSCMCGRTCEFAASVSGGQGRACKRQLRRKYAQIWYKNFN